MFCQIAQKHYVHVGEVKANRSYIFEIKSVRISQSIMDYVLIQLRKNIGLSRYVSIMFLLVCNNN